MNTGGRYDPATNSWKTISLLGAPAGRAVPRAVWTGSEMIIWGGYYSDGSSHYLNDGGRYQPATDSWTAVSQAGAPAGRYYHTSVWTGSEMIVWGGSAGTSFEFNDGGRYFPTGDSWTPMITSGAPPARREHTVVWTGSEMIVWGGYDSSGSLNDTFSYTPNRGAFRITNVVLEHGDLVLSFPTLADHSYTLWRTETLAQDTWTDTGLPALVGTGAILSFTVPATAPPRRFFRVRSDQ